MDAKTFRRIDLPKFPGADHVGFGEFDWGGNKVMVSVIKATTPRVSYVFDFAAKKLTQWVEPSQPEIDTSKSPKTGMNILSTVWGNGAPVGALLL